MKYLIAVLFFIFSASTSLQANVLGSDFQNFNPTADGLDFVTVHSSETLDKCFCNFGLFFNYAGNTLPYFEVPPSDATGRNTYRDRVLYMDLNMAFGLMKDWQVGLNVPFHLSQTVESDLDHGVLVNTGITEIRASTKYRFFGDDRGGMAGVLSTTFNRIENNPYTGEGSSPGITLELAYDRTLGKKLATAVNIGYRWRNPGLQTDPDIEPYRNQFIASGALSYHFPSMDTKLIGEIFGSWPTEELTVTHYRNQSSLELLAGIKHDVDNSFSFHVGGGTELSHSTGSPDWRVYTGINWAFGSICDKKDKAPQLTRINPNYVSEYVDEDELKDMEDPLEDYRDEASPDPVPDERYVLRNIHFKFDSGKKVYQGSKYTIDRLMKRILDKGRFSKIIVVGHTDSIGSEDYNEKLSVNRANTVKTYIATKYRIPKSKIESKGYGEFRPVADNGNFQGRRKNRRVEIEVFR